MTHVTIAARGQPSTLTPIYTTEADFDLTASRIASETEPEYTAWTYFVTNYVTPYVSSTPTPASPGDVETYTALDTDSRRCRNQAIAWRLSDDATYGAQVVNYLPDWSDPETGGAPYVGSEQNAYHQAYGVYSFAFAYQAAYDLFGEGQRTQVEAWFQTWADAMESMMDTWATNYYFSHTSRSNYAWELDGGGYLTKDTQDWYEGRDATFAPMCAWLASAICCGDSADVTNITTQHRLKLPTVLHSACSGDNDGDGVAGHPDPVPTMTIHSTIDYMTYNARLLTMAYALLDNLGLATQTQKDELYATWVYLSRFFGTNPETVPRPGDTINHSVADARFQMPLHIWGDAEFLDDVENSTVDPTQFYESQFLGPTTLVAPTEAYSR